MDELVLLGRVPVRRQAVNRFRLQEALRSKDLVREIDVDRSGYFEVKRAPWDEYWSPFRDQLSPAFEQQLGELRTACNLMKGCLMGMS